MTFSLIQGSQKGHTATKHICYHAFSCAFNRQCCTLQCTKILRQCLIDYSASSSPFSDGLNAHSLQLRPLFIHSTSQQAYLTDIAPKKWLYHLIYQNKYGSSQQHPSQQYVHNENVALSLSQYKQLQEFHGQQCSNSGTKPLTRLQHQKKNALLQSNIKLAGLSSPL